MSNRTDIVVETDNAEGQVLLSASRVYDLTEDKTQDTINSEIRNTLNQLDTEKADEESLALRRSGTTNTGAQIENGTYFYLDGTLKHAIATIAQNASFTDQNCETITAGGLNDLKSSFLNVVTVNVNSVSIESNNIFLAELTVQAPPGYTPIGVCGFDLSRTNGLYITRVCITPGTNILQIGGFNSSSTAVLNGKVYSLIKKI